MPRSKTVKKAPRATRSRTTTKDEGNPDILKICKWAKKNGAVQIKVDGLEILFPPPDLESVVTKAPNPGQIRVEPGASGNWRDWINKGESTETGPPAIRSREDDPDLFARDSDAWANQTRLPRR
jgi:hypothetical protein